MDDKHLIETELKNNTLFTGRIINLRDDDVLLPNGKQAKREYVEHRGGASILAVDDDKNVYLVRQFRYPYREVLLEIPAGKLEKGEDPATTAARELEEETGFVGNIKPYGLIYPTPGYTNEHLYVFLAENLKRTHVHCDEDEFLDVVKLPIQTVLKDILDGKIKDGKTCYAVLKYAVENKLPY